MNLIYNFSMRLFSVIINLFKNSNPKIKLFVEGRKDVFQEIINFSNNNTKQVAWFHVASLGEYEQAKPVISQLKKEMPEISIVVSFFSPSGYENAKKKLNNNLDLIVYLPIDTRKNAKKFIETLNPAMAFFVKYDLWANYILEAKKRKVPLYLFSASMREDQVYFQPFGGFFRRVLKSFTHIFTQNEKSIDLLLQIGVKNCSLTGDTRFDRVSKISESPRDFPEINQFVGDSKTIVIGSAWEEDMNILIPFINESNGYKFIIAPHEISDVIVDRWAEKIKKKTVKHSEIEKNFGADVLFIDNIGMLSSLYRFAYIAYVGGAFGKGLHNILEPLAFGIPVVFGKVRKPKKFPEAKISMDYGASCSVSNIEELLIIMKELENPELYNQACNSANKLVKENLGSSKKIIDQVMASK
ncbi:3-deoxy-D-manno-octulosonic acid transferase [Belliella sp. DSM 107340]|uniref:3-deoxy-D-manno-octulosonic acid transferase n=1 Tax=Belliella calami TaxID=2923436 RepID=A0ABS9UTN4_9BACT|nr:glycosyltransferase N-terminal domain-containing protein [Belliella calami]MCH7399980.1 3-deoxy-D-manno-octulosonic acid transferase [Belliella calami]